MKVDITALLIFFDEQLVSLTNEELGEYWFGTTRPDSLRITLSFSIHESYVGVLVGNGKGIGIASIDMKDCSEIRVLDEKRKCLEIIREKRPGRCFLHLMGDDIVTYEE